MSEKINWESLRRAYVEGSASLRQLAREAGVSTDRLYYRAKKERWAALREEQRDPSAEAARLAPLRAAAEDVSRQLARLAQAAADSETEETDPRELKNLTACIKELAAVQRDLYPREEASREVVVTMGKALRAFSE